VREGYFFLDFSTIYTHTVICTIAVRVANRFLSLAGENERNQVFLFTSATYKRSLFIENIGKKYDNAKKA
jgi:hypothetical protein